MHWPELALQGKGEKKKARRSPLVAEQELILRDPLDANSQIPQNVHSAPGPLRGSDLSHRPLSSAQFQASVPQTPSWRHILAPQARLPSGSILDLYL